MHRGPDNQKLRKVKCHATEEDISKGVSNSFDKMGNDKNDIIVDVGVERIAGRGLVRLGEWIAARHKKYIEFVGRVQKYIATIILAEKQEREKRKQQVKLIDGYDANKWTIAD